MLQEVARFGVRSDQSIDVAAIFVRRDRNFGFLATKFAAFA
jgi:hypothetical protein